MGANTAKDITIDSQLTNFVLTVFMTLDESMVFLDKSIEVNLYPTIKRKGCNHS